MIYVKFTGFCDLRADLRIRLAILRKFIRKFWLCKLASSDLCRLAIPLGQGLRVRRVVVSCKLLTELRGMSIHDHLYAQDEIKDTCTPTTPSTSATSEFPQPPVP